MLDYEKIKKEIIHQNMAKVIEDYMKPDFQKKIDKYSEKFNIPREEIINKIKQSDSITISIFAKDPSKQNFYEKTAAQFIKKIEGVVDFVNLPNGGKNAIYIDKDNVRRKEEFNAELPSKSVDFQWKFKIGNIQYYAFHKYINETGGAQDNQFNDVFNSIIAARAINSRAKHRVIFICDGNYFTNKKIEMLKEAIINKNHKVLKISELEKYLNEE